MPQPDGPTMQTKSLRDNSRFALSTASVMSESVAPGARYSIRTFAAVRWAVGSGLAGIGGPAHWLGNRRAA